MEILLDSTFEKRNTSRPQVTSFFSIFIRVHSYGWDWGPVLMTVGPWRPTRFEIYDDRIEDLRICSAVSKDLNVDIEIAISTLSKDSRTSVDISIASPKGVIIWSKEGVSLENGKGKVNFKLKKGDFELWWPVGYGTQTLYSVEVFAKSEVRLLSSGD